MFRENPPVQQSSLFDSQQWMSARRKKRLENSWAQTFREEVFARIPEEIFAVLYSEVDSRPNAPINVLVGGEILKSGFGWTDETLEEQWDFNQMTRHALMLDELDEEAPTLRTVYNLRKAVRRYAQETGINLYEEVFALVTDEQLAKMEIETGWQRMDSTQLLSNIARLNRLELVIAVLQKGVKGLPEAEQETWKQTEALYLSKPAQNVCYRLKNEETEKHLQRVGELLLALLSQLQALEGAESLLVLVQRTLAEQYELVSEQAVALKAAEEIEASALQSPHDPEATYREKNGGSYKGYVCHLSETCDPQNPLQLITSVKTAPNTTDDGALLAQSVEDLVQREVDIEQATLDGGYNGSTAEEACAEYGIDLRPTRIRGSQPASDRFGWAEYQWHKDEEGQPQSVTCPQGQQVDLEAGRKPHRWLARFDPDICASCPFFKQECRVKALKRKPPTLSGDRRDIQVAWLRQGMSAQNAAIRAGVESTIHAFKHPFRAGKLPVRGLIRAHMMACGSALMVNLRRLHAYFHSEDNKSEAEGEILPVLTLFWPLFRGVGDYLNPSKAEFGLQRHSGFEAPVFTNI